MARVICQKSPTETVQISRLVNLRRTHARATIRTAGAVAHGPLITHEAAPARSNGTSTDIWEIRLCRRVRETTAVSGMIIAGGRPRRRAEAASGAEIEVMTDMTGVDVAGRDPRVGTGVPRRGEIWMTNCRCPSGSQTRSRISKSWLSTPGCLGEFVGSKSWDGDADCRTVTI